MIADGGTGVIKFYCRNCDKKLSTARKYWSCSLQCPRCKEDMRPCDCKLVDPEKRIPSIDKTRRITKKWTV